MELLERATKPEDLEAINQIAYSEMKADDVFTFKVRLIDDKPTANKRLYTKEWRAANVNQFIGAPIIYRHDISGSAEAVGYVYQTDLLDDSINGYAYIPTNTESGRAAVEKIHNGQLKSMSLHAISPNVKKVGDILHILPSENDRVLEVSFAAVGGCAACGIVKECCETDSAESVDDIDTALREFAEQEWSELRSEYIRLAAFAFGSSINKADYKTVAESVSPQTLKTMVNDLRKTIQKSKENGNVDELKCSDEQTEKLKQSLQSIRKAKGV
jgi:hypothetical protein